MLTSPSPTYHALFELTNLALPLPHLVTFSASSPSFRTSPFNALGPIEPPAYSAFARRRPVGNLLRPLVDPSSVVGMPLAAAAAAAAATAAAGRSRRVGAGGGFNQGPTRPGTSNPPTPAPRRPAAPSLNPASARDRSLPNQDPNRYLNPPPFQNPSASTAPTTTSATTITSHSVLSSNCPLHRPPDSSSGSTAAYEANSDDLFFLNELVSRDFSSPPPILARSPRENLSTRDTTSTPNLVGLSGTRPDRSDEPATTAGPAETPAVGGDSDDSEVMPSHTRSKRAPRAGDLSFPPASSGSQAGPSTRPTSSAGQRRSSRGSALQTSQQPLPSQSSSIKKRKRDDDTAVVKGEADDEDIFGDDLFGDHDVVDLVDMDEVPAEIRSQKTKNYVKLSAFNCVICMDDVTDLTVTHCGHLFCSGCLHSALNIDATKRICPICRQRIDNLPSNGKWSQRAKGYYPLELKLMTKTTLGKRTAES
ncbi:hypothetical protein MFIFM68171_10401 [Madurella fahalii]|uniref:RING-type domain-containing protein n=1 Tax=Madurella fahalii TaxID=1157608 RepID=A0ABQ0GR25_9PEZI